MRVTMATCTGAQRQVALMRLAMVGEVIGRPKYESEFHAIARVCKATPTRKGKAFPETTLRRWIAWFHAHGADGLVPQYRSDRGVRRVLAGRRGRGTPTTAEIDELIRDVLCSRGKAWTVRQLLKKQWPALKIPRKTAERWVRTWKRANAHLVAFATEGEGRWIDRHELALGWSPVDPLKIAMLDSTTLDLSVLVQDVVSGAIKDIRPHVSLYLDVGSRAAIAFEVTVGKPTPATMMSLLWRAWGDGANRSGMATVPLPERVIVDAGAEHRGEFQEALESLGLGSRLVKQQPESHAHVERAIQTVFAQDAVLGQFGHTETDRVANETDTSTRQHDRGRRAAARENAKGERDRRDLMTLDELLEHIHHVCIEYNARLHRGIQQDARNHRAAKKAA
ncbi:MAG: hypothetical protein ACK5W7_08335 [Gemmatimonadaceae bacterium]|jgi:hypothetical protein